MRRAHSNIEAYSGCSTEK